MIGFCPLASGSKGNCIYVGDESTKILIDAGLSAKATKQRLSELNLSLSDIDAILVTHEHGDHIKGIEVIASSYNIPILTNSDTAKAVYQTCKSPLKFKIFATGESFCFGSMQILPFSISHDAIDPVAFTIELEGKKLGFCADLGVVTTPVASQLMHCDHLYLEANHEPSMVYASSRPIVYKERVLGRQGHLSNDECISLLTKIAHSNLKSIHLAHLSSECNSEALALQKIQAAMQALQINPNVFIAYQDKISNPIYLHSDAIFETL